MSPEDISKNFGESYHCKNWKFENFDESQLYMVSPGLVKVSWKDLWEGSLKMQDITIMLLICVDIQVTNCSERKDI